VLPELGRPAESAYGSTSPLGANRRSRWIRLYKLIWQRDSGL